MKKAIKIAVVAITVFALWSFAINAGETYKTIKVGSQEWMAQNLDVDHYRNGDIIPQVQDPAKWAKLKTGAWCNYEFKEGDHVVKGKLYNGYAVTDPRGLAPAGWSIPKSNDWYDHLSKWFQDSSKGYLRDDTAKIRLFVGDDLQTMNCEKNMSYFRYSTGGFGAMKCIGLWWLPGDEDLTYQLSRCEGHDGAYFGMAGLPADWKNYGFYVRCVKK